MKKETIKKVKKNPVGRPPKKDKKKEKKVKKLIIICVISAIILVSSTYAWFIGMKTVNVSSFDVEIATTEGLFLSMDGENWSYTLDAKTEEAYEGNTNTWAEDGLIPMSTVGIIDPTSSRLKLYEKGSLTTTPGGYRLMASRVRNYETTTGTMDQGKGYVAFDLFVKNLSGTEYYPEMNVLNEEAIYLTKDSQVTVASDGGEPNTGIENSVRVAFAQIGRVKADAAVSDIIGISCEGGTGVTSICTDRDAQIWEPNDTEHVANAINWYTTSCLARTGADLTSASSYSGTCGTVEHGTSYPTYAVSGVIDYSDQVDVYDGEGYNGYTASISESADDGKLVAYDYFTDTEKNYDGVNRPTFITLAPNSVTKIRVYVFIEGQDIDNYDFASLGKKISVNFGFTKERFYGEDINYDDTDTAELPDDVIKSSHTTSRSSVHSE